MRPGVGFFLVIWSAVGATVSLARADDRAEIDKARSAFQRKEYADVERRLGHFADASTTGLRDQAVLPEAYFLLASALFRLGRPDTAWGLLDAIAAKRPDVEPDALLFPPEVVDGFADAKGRIRERVAEQQVERERLQREAVEARARDKKKLEERIAKLEAFAKTETLVEQHGRALAFAPFGLGQFQNGDKGLGWVLLTGQSLALLTCAITVVVYDRALDDAYATRDQPGVSRQYLARASTTQTLNVISAITGLVLAAGGVVEAQVNFVPSVRVTRDRTSDELAIVVGASASF